MTRLKPSHNHPREYMITLSYNFCYKRHGDEISQNSSVYSSNNSCDSEHLPHTWVEVRNFVPHLPLLTSFT